MGGVTDLAADYQALRAGAGAVWLARDALRVAGPEAAAFLHGQLSQGILALAAGDAAESLVLSPQGKVDALVRVLRIAEDEFLLDVDEGYAGDLVARLSRFKLRTKADIDEVPGWSVVAVRGAASPPPPSAETLGAIAVIGVEGAVLSGYDVCSIGARPLPAGVQECGEAAYEALRIEAGLPVMGRELTGATIPAEAGVVDRTVSFTKGCYTGQELVARIDSRGGNVARHLRGLVIDGSDGPVPGAAIVVEGAPAGEVTSAAFSPGFGAWVALGYVHRRVEPPAAATVERADGPPVGARILDLPMVP